MNDVDGLMSRFLQDTCRTFSYEYLQVPPNEIFGQEPIAQLIIRVCGGGYSLHALALHAMFWATHVLLHMSCVKCILW